MTRRVIQTDLFTAFQESQRRAEEQIGSKRAIRIEGSAVRQGAPDDTAPQVRHMHGFEVISSPSAAAVILDSAPAIATPASSELSLTESPAPAETAATTSAIPVQRERLSVASGERVKVEAPRAVAAPEAVTRSIAPAPVPQDPSFSLVKIAGVAFAVTAAFIVGRSTSEPEVREVKIYVPTPAATAPAITAPTTAGTASTAETTAPEAAVEAPAAAVSTGGKYTVLLVSGISKKQAEKLAAALKKDSGFDVFVKGGSVYVGRFEKAFTDEINKVEKFCREYKFEGRAQFTDALQVPIPGTR